MSDRQGGCLCGAIRYRITGDPVSVAVCHCTDCQTQSGSAFGMSMVVGESHFELTEGEPRSFSTKADSGAEKTGFFCGDCGARIFNRLSSMQGTVNVKPGTLDDTAWITPKLQVWLSSKQPWVPIVEDLPRFDRNIG